MASSRPLRPGLVSTGTAGLWQKLMTEGLRYATYGAHGSDIGAQVTARLGLGFPDTVTGIHLSAADLPNPPGPPESWSARNGTTPPRSGGGGPEEGGCAQIPATKPQTLGYGLTDSPAGLAAWIIEKFRSWSDSHGDAESRFSREQLLTIYWVTGTITSSVRLYYEDRRHERALPVSDPVRIPAGLAIFANESIPFGQPPRELRSVSSG